MDSIKAAWSEGSAAPEQKTTETAATETKTTETPTVEDTYDPPTDWPNEEREAFRGYQPEVRKWALTKLRSVEDGWKTKAADLEKFQGAYKPIDELFKNPQYQPHFQGLPAHEVTRRLLDQLAFAQSKPKDFVQHFVKSMNLNPAEIFQLQKEVAAAVDANAGYVDPELASVRAELAQVKKVAQETQAQFEQRQRREQEQRDADWNKAITDFRNATDKDGKTPKHPYVKDVEGHMAALIKNGVVTGSTPMELFEKAYRQAIYANDETRAKVLADEKASERREAERKEREHAEKAKNAAKTVTSSGSRTDSTPSDKQKKGESVRDSLKAAAAELKARKDAA